MDEDGYDRTEIGKTILENYLHQVLDVGVFHGDLHQGNIMLIHGVPYWIDFGMIGKVSDKCINTIQDILFSLIQKDVEGLTNAAMAFGRPTGKVNKSKLMDDIYGLMEQYGSIASIDVGDLFEIETVKTYLKDHMKMIYEAKNELTKGVRPELKALPEEFEQYDTVFLGYPNWWNTLPMPVVSFLEKLDWTGKRIIPYNTSEGSGLGKSVGWIREICKGAVVEDGFALKGSQVDEKQADIAGWAKEQLS